METRTKTFSIVLFALFLITAIAVVCVVLLSKSNDNESGQDTFYKRGAVASDARVCSDIGVDAMKNNGTAVDAAIAALFCLGLIHPHSSGIGGGGFFLIYQRSKKKATFLDFRETAPAASTVDMFVNKTKESRTGTMSVAVPGEVLAMYTAWKSYGRLPWKRLVQPTIDLATNGYEIDEPLSIVLEEKKDDLIKERGFREVFYHDDNSTRKQGEIITDPTFAKTLTKIGENPTSFYNGSIAREIVKDIQDRKGIITEYDLRNFTVKEREVLKSTMTNGDILYTTSAPSSGSTLIMILNILKGFNFSSDALSSSNIVLTWHRILESFKFGYAYRPYLGDPDFVPGVEESMKLQINSTYAEELRQKIWDNTTHDSIYYGGFYRSQSDPGTTHLSVLGPLGDTVSVTSTIGSFFGAKIRSYNTGIVYNNHMATFSLPNVSKSYQPKSSKSNHIAPGKRSVSTSCPAIIVDKSGTARMAVGGSGSLRITSGVPTVIINKLLFGLSLDEAISTPRLHHQLYPNEFTYEKKAKYRMKQSVIDGLHALGHKSKANKRYCAIQGVYRDNSGNIYAKSDPRKTGVATGF